MTLFLATPLPVLAAPLSSLATPRPFLAAWMPGWPEIVLILVLVLILFGPRKLPEVADAMGKSIRRFKSASREATDTVKKELDDARDAVNEATSDDDAGSGDSEKPRDS
jgi:TatA/E family protein of Tat protein translocase